MSSRPGAAAEPHFHKGFESAVYVLEGRVETLYGPGLEESVITEAGDFLFTPPGVRPQYLTQGLKKGRPLWHNGCANKQL